MADLYDLQRILIRAANELPRETLVVMEVEGMKFIAKNFDEQGFHGTGGLQKWKPRKTVDKRGRDITRYRTNRYGKQGGLTAYGRRNHGRAILTGFNTGGNKLRNSIDSRKTGDAVTFYTYKPYAQRHNEGLNGMPERRFMGESPVLDKHIADKIKTILDNQFK